MSEEKPNGGRWVNCVVKTHTHTNPDGTTIEIRTMILDNENPYSPQ